MPKNVSKVALGKLLPTISIAKRKARILKWANKLGIKYTTMYNRWYATHFPPNARAGIKKSNNIPLYTPPTLPATTGKGGIVPYVLEVNVATPTRIDKTAAEGIRSKLRPIIQKMVPMGENDTVHSVTIFETDRGVVRRWLSSEFPKKVFTIDPVAGKKGMYRIFRKS